MPILLLKPENDDVKSLYLISAGYKGDAGFDLYCTEDQVIPASATSVKINFHISCEMVENIKITDLKSGRFKYVNGKSQSYYLYPRSSLGSKTTLRLSNSVGVIDSGYRGPIMAFVDNIGNKDVTFKKGDRWFQICSSNLDNITMEFVDNLSASERGTQGFGSTTSE
jgi:dUTP pyrophosphatase